jgi:glycosyltransferase involved in cell wall biosynthesis
MIVTDVGGLAEAVPDGKVGFVTEPDPKSIADAILRFFQPGSLPDLKKHLTEEKAKYSWQTFIDALFTIASSSETSP